MVRLLLQHFRILESVYKVELFLLHANDLHFIQLLFSTLAVKLLLYLGTCTILLLLKIKLALGLSLLLLDFDHHFDVLGSLFFFSSILMQPLLS
jgi:hypothetical protein